MENVVKILEDSYGENYNDSSWHLVSPINPQGSATFCEDLYFGYGESGVKFKVKTGKITCKKCIEMVKIIQKIDL